MERLEATQRQAIDPQIQSRLAEFKTAEWVHAAMPVDLQPAPKTIAANEALKNRVLRGAVRMGQHLSTPRVVRFVTEQEFGGVVLSIDPDNRSFFARLVDHTASHPDEEVEMSFEDISPDDRYLVVPGALFSWTIGRSERGGQVQRLSEIRFRRLVPATQKVIDKAKAKAAALYASLVADD